MSSGRGPPDIKGMSSLKVDNLTYRTTSDDLRRVFEKYGEIGDIYIPRDRFSRESRGFAFVRYFDRRDAEDAMESMDGRRIDGRELRVQMARYGRPETPPYKRKRRRSRSRSRSRDRRRRRSYSRSRSRSRSRERRRRSRSASRSRSRSRSRSGSKSRSRSPGAGVEEERPSSKSPEVRDEENGLHQRSSPSAAADDNGRGSRSPGKDAADRGSASPDRRSKSASRSRSRSRSSD